MRDRRPAVGQPDLDCERIAPVHRRRPGGGGIEFARHHLMQSLEDQLLADGRNAIGRGGRDLRLLDGLINQVGLVAADLFGIRPRADLRPFANSSGHGRRYPRKRFYQKLGNGRGLGVLEHAHQPAQFHAVRMRLDFLGFGRQRLGHPLVFAFILIRIGIMDGHVRIGDGGLFQILVHAAPTALVLAFQLDGHPGAVLRFDPFDAVLFNGLCAGIAGRDFHALAPAV